MEDYDEIIEEFLVESHESLDQLDQDLIELEDAPDNLDRLASIFRTVHTIKGTAGFLAFPKLEKVAHVGESLLVPLRDGDLDLTRDMADGLLGMVDAIRDILGNIENIGAEGEQEFEELVAKLGVLKSGNVTPQTEPTPNPSEATTTDTADASDAETKDETEQSETEQSNAKQNEAKQNEPTANDAGTQDEVNTPTPTDADPTVPSAGSIVDTIAQPTSETVIKKPKPSPDAEISERSAAADSNVRINVELLDKLMNLGRRARSLSQPDSPVQ